MPDIKLIKKILPLYLALALIFISFSVGTAVMFFRLPSYLFYQHAYTGLKAWEKKREVLQNLQLMDENSNLNVTINRPEALQGYTLVTYGLRKQVLLIDMQGKIVHSWTMNFYQAFPHPEHIDNPIPEKLIVWSDIYLYPNGDLLGIYQAMDDSPAGYGLIKLDRNSNIIWRYAGKMHHYLDVDEKTGNIYALSHGDSRKEVPGVYISSFPITRDYLVILSPDGKLLKKISLLDALAQSPYRDFISLSSDRDILHTNRPLLLRDGVPMKAPYMKPGQVVVSFRNIHALALLDPVTEQIIHVWRGPWSYQHDPELLPNGNFLLFDNMGIRTQDKEIFSRVLEYDPATENVVWTFGYTPDYPFYSSRAGTAHRLPNGNTLIASSWDTKVFEVTPEKKVVWEMKVGHALQARRYTPEQLPFLHQSEPPKASP